MLRMIVARRGLRRAGAAVCSALVIAATAAALGGRGGARAAPAPPDSGGHSDARAPTAATRLARAAGSAAPQLAASPDPPWPDARQLLLTETGNRVLAYPPLPTAGGDGAASRGPLPVVMMLHGMCGEAQLACDFWSDAGRERSWLVCPAGNARCGEHDDWKGTGEEKAGALDEAMEAVDRAYGPAAVTHAEGDILIGFSRGAFVARDVAYARPGRFRALVLLGASMTPDAARLKASGIRRIVMGAGEHDGARPTMQRAARALDAAGIPTRYVSLGRIPHALPNDLEDILRDALAWIREDAQAKPGAPGGNG